MKIDRVTFTGADDSIDPTRILRVVDEYPAIKTEWALLLSKSNEGKQTRYPSLLWMEEFMKCSNEKMFLAGHIQGHWLRTMLEGKPTFPKDRPTIHNRFHRIQLNFHGVQAVASDDFYTEIRNSPQEYIFQMDGVNENIYYIAQELGISNLRPLFDLSAGRGIVPESWPKPVNLLNGYAGGLGPHNIMEQLKRIEAVAENSLIWLDMETHIRSENDDFDLDKCRRVLDVISKFTNS